MPLTGELIIGAARVAKAETLRAVNPATGRDLDPPFSAAGPEEIERACALAAAAFDAFRESGLEQRAQFLEGIAEGLMQAGDALIARAAEETALPVARLEGERARTVGQLRLFADLARRGDWLGVRVDPALPERTPLPRPDLRQRKIAVGPVAVFGASNFPLAFSVAGGDTAAALAAGCPVIAKGHPAHPGVSEFAGTAILHAALAAGLPEGVFSLLHGSLETGQALVTDPRIKAVAFTGSRVGGLALTKLAQARPEPIPVFAEMSSINPIILLPGALKARAEALGADFVSSLTLGAGQFCTNPGLLFGMAGPDFDRFLAAAGKAVSESRCAVMLTRNIHDFYVHGTERLGRLAGVTRIARAEGPEGMNMAAAALFAVDARTFMQEPELREEVFGPASLAVRCRDEKELAAALESLEGQLTATLHLDAEDEAAAALLLPVLERKAGRIIANGWPTGVEVCQAIVHGGPFPATTDPRTTSVGTLAIERFLRPVCYQNLPDHLLPAAVKHDNPLRLARLVEGTREAED